MDIPYDGNFTGYGANAGQPAAAGATPSYTEEVKARIAKIHAPTAPAAAAPVVEGGATASRFAVPSWLKTAGGFGARILGRVGPVGAIAAAGQLGGPLLEAGAKGLAGLYTSGEGSSMAPPKVGGAAAAVVPPAPTGLEAQPDSPAGTDTVSSTAAPAPAPFIQPATPENTVVPPSGTGFIKNNQTGAVTNIGTPGGATGAPRRDYTGGNAAAAFFQAGAHVKQIANDNAQHMAGAKLLLDGIVKGSEANKNNAQAGNFGVRTTAAVEHLRANPGDYAGAGAVASGRAVPGKSVFMPTMNADKVDVGDTRTGKVSRVTVPAQVTEADIQKTMLSNKLTRDQVIKRLKDEGRM